MRDELCALHDAITAHLQELETMLTRATVDRADLANVRWRLSRASKQRLSMLERRIYPHLTGLMSEAEARAVRQLQEATGPLVAQTVSHVCTWTVDHIVSDLAGYKSASAMMRTTMRARIKLERDVLYPLLIQHRGSKTPVGADLFAPLRSAA